MSSLRLIGLFAGLLALTACGNRLDSHAVEAEIKAEIERQGRRLTLQAVRCPTNILRQAEAYFRCVGELEPAGTFPINVVQQDNQGNVTWEVPNSAALLNLAAVENEIQSGLAATFSQRPYVDCGSELYRLNQAGDQFECQLVGGLSVEGDRIESVLVRVNPDGDLEWQEQRSAPRVPENAASRAPAIAPASKPAPVNTLTGPDSARGATPEAEG